MIWICSRNTERSALPSFFESNNSSSYLYTLLYARDFQVKSILLHQSAKFALVIKYIIIVLNFIDPGMISWHRNVSNSDLALMSSSDLDAIRWNILDDHHIVGLLADSF